MSRSHGTRSGVYAHADGTQVHRVARANGRPGMGTERDTIDPGAVGAPEVFNVDRILPEQHRACV